MRIAVAQIQPFKGDIQRNIVLHTSLIHCAISHKATAVFFPELSMTGYEPELAEDLASDENDRRFDGLQQLSNESRIMIGVGMPLKSEAGIQIGMIIFQPNLLRQRYSKQFLHEDELPFFIPGNKQTFFKIGDVTIAPAICYESLLPEHAAYAFKNGADVYLASVAKSQSGIEKAIRHYPEIARKYSKPILMSNCVGVCDSFKSMGTSSVWNSAGKLLGQLDDKREGMLIFDTETIEVGQQIV